MRPGKIVVVVVVGDVVDVSNMRIGDVDVAKIGVAYVSATMPPSTAMSPASTSPPPAPPSTVPPATSPSTIEGIERFTPTQWEPAKAAAYAPASAESKTDSEAASSDPAHQGRRVIGVPVSEGSGSPAPSAVPVDPASIVERRKSPRSIIHPSPSPRFDPRPVTVAVGRPARLHRSGYPDRAIHGRGLPDAIGVEVLITNHTRRNIARRQRTIQPFVAHLRPVVETIASRRTIGSVLQRIGSAESDLQTGVDPHRRPITRGLAVAAAHRHPCLIFTGMNVEAIDTGLHHREGDIRSVNLVNLAPLQVADGHFQDALVQFELDRVIADITERQAGLGIHADETIAHVQFGTRVLVRPNPVSRRERPIHAGCNPVVHPAGLHGNFAGHVLHARHAPRRVLHLLSGSIVRPRSVIRPRSIVLHRRVGRRRSV